MRKFNAIKNAVNFGKSQKRRDAETRKVINWLDSQKEKREMKIQVNDKVKWLHPFQALNQTCFGHVVSTDEKVMGNPCFLIWRMVADPTLDACFMVSKDKVSLAQGK